MQFTPEMVMAEQGRFHWSKSPKGTGHKAQTRTTPTESRSKRGDTDGQYKNDAWFIGLLTGPDNTTGLHILGDVESRYG